jgi:hypothetical protein
MCFDVHGMKIIEPDIRPPWGVTLPAEFYSIAASSSSSDTVAKLLTESLIA